MARIVRVRKPDVVFSPGIFHLIILAFLARQSFNARPVFVSKLSNPIRRSGIRHWLEPLADAAIRFAARPVDGLIAMSPSLAAEARAVFRNIAVTEIAEPILEDDHAQPGRARQAATAPLILCAARLAPQKDLITALRAFAQLPATVNARLLILGEGPRRPSLEREIARLGIAAQVEMPGHVANISPYLAEADLYLMTSHYDGYPAVLVEAIAADVPIVTTDCSLALPEILPAGALGTVVKSRDPAKIAVAIAAQLARPKPDPAIASKITSQHCIGHAAAYLSLFDSLAPSL